MGCVGRGRSPHGPLRLRSDELACGEARAEGGGRANPATRNDYRPPRDKADAAEVYVTGASGGDYWISWYDDTGDVKEVRRRPGTIVRDPEPYRIDISKAPTDGDDVLFVVAGKRTAWEGDLALVLKVGAKFRDCFSNDATDPANSEVQVLFEIGSPEANSVCRSQLSVHYAGPQPPRMLAKGPSPLTNSTAGGAGPQRRSSRP
jgi:hypothetical protein